MANDIRIDVYDGSVNCDRYHLLKANDNVPNDHIIYTEIGDAFNGWYNPVILNVDYDTIKNSRLVAVTISGVNAGNMVFYLVDDIRRIRQNKTMIIIEPDSWMNYRHRYRLQWQNYIYETTDNIDYPFYEKNGKFKRIDTKYQFFTSETFHILILFHDETDDVDYVYYCDMTNWQGIGSILYLLGANFNLDSNTILGIWLSPFDLSEYLQSPSPFGNPIYDITGLRIYKASMDGVVLTSITRAKQITLKIVNNDISQDCILDMSGAITWKSEFKDNGNRYLVASLDINFDNCSWACYIGTTNINSQQTSPNNRFSIPCLSLGFMADYYQEYQNLNKSFTAELRQAQLEKQLIDGIGNIASSTLNMGVVGGMGGKSASGALGGAVASSVGLAVGQFSAVDYNKKLEDIENRQAKVQYDLKQSVSNSIHNFLTTASRPCLATISCDAETENGYTLRDGVIRKTYNCGMRMEDAKDLIDSGPLYLSGDFDFSGIPVSDIEQLKERFKHGVNFVSWTDEK